MLLDIAGSASFRNPSMEILNQIKFMVSPKPIEGLIFSTFPAKWIKWRGATAVKQKLLVGTERKTKASEARLLLTQRPAGRYRENFADDGPLPEQLIMISWGTDVLRPCEPGMQLLYHGEVQVTLGFVSMQCLIL